MPEVRLSKDATDDTVVPGGQEVGAPAVKAARAGLGTVRMQVRRYALMLKFFTVEEMVTRFGLNASSVQTEIQRLIEGGYVTSDGRKPAHYEITADPEKRLELAQGLFSAPDLSTESSSPRLPTSRHYRKAEQTITRAQHRLFLNRHECRRLQDQAQHHLEVAHEDEGGRRAPDSVRAYLDYERARLSTVRSLCAPELWHQHRPYACDIYRRVRPAFETWQDWDRVADIKEYLALDHCLQQILATHPGGAWLQQVGRAVLEAYDPAADTSPLLSLAHQFLSAQLTSPQAQPSAALFQASPRIIAGRSDQDDRLVGSLYASPHRPSLGRFGTPPPSRTARLSEGNRTDD